MDDVVVIGCGPAALISATALAEAGLRVRGLAPQPPETPWPNTYGVWCDELEPFGMLDLLSHRWDNTVAYTSSDQPVALKRGYGLIDNQRFQASLLVRAERAGVVWQPGTAVGSVGGKHSHTVTTRDGLRLTARLLLDASGHNPVLLQRGRTRQLAYQAAYGVVGYFNRPPVEAGQLVLMDYRANHLTSAAQQEPATFLYAMDLGDGRYFVEETSLAHAPGLKMAQLEQRLWRRLAHTGIVPQQIEHIERCFFPMNPGMASLRQPIAGFGAAASMVHPASGYSVGAMLRHAPGLADAIVRVLGQPGATPAQAARAAWQALWPRERLQKRSLYLFGLAALMYCRLPELQGFFNTFYQLPVPRWRAYLADTLSLPELASTMLWIFRHAPWQVRSRLVQIAGIEHRLLVQALGR